MKRFVFCLALALVSQAVAKEPPSLRIREVIQRDALVDSGSKVILEAINTTGHALYYLGESPEDVPCRFETKEKGQWDSNATDDPRAGSDIPGLRPPEDTKPKAGQVFPTGSTLVFAVPFSGSPNPDSIVRVRALFASRTIEANGLPSRETKDRVDLLSPTIASVDFVRRPRDPVYGQELDFKVLKETETLVIHERMPDPFFRQIPTLNRQREAARSEKQWVEAVRSWKEAEGAYQTRLKKRIRTTPGLKPYLWFLVEKSYRHGGRFKAPRAASLEIILNDNLTYDGGTDLKRVLNTLAGRDDLEPVDFATIRREVAEIFGYPVSRGDLDDSRFRIMQRQYLKSAMKFLARDPTAENEALLVQALNWQNDAQVNTMAAVALAEGGFPGAVPPIQLAFERLDGAQFGYYAEYVRQALDRLQRKLDPSLPPSKFSEGPAKPKWRSLAEWETGSLPPE